MIQQYSSLIDYITVKSDKRNIHIYILLYFQGLFINQFVSKPAGN